MNAHQFATAPPLVDDPLGELERVEHGFVLRLADSAEAAVSTAVGVLVVDEDGYSLYDRPLEQKAPPIPEGKVGSNAKSITHPRLSPKTRPRETSVWQCRR